MDKLNSIDFALDPRHPPSFLLDWEITMKCNLDCSYCFTGLDGGHDNTTEHPPLEKCLESIDFMYQYVDEYMKFKKTYQKKVVLNVYGGESIFHPDIVTILENCRSKYLQYQDKWHLTISCTTNGIAGSNLWSKLVPLIDDFTLSYHTESLPKQKEQFKKNLLALKQSDKTFKCLIVMHNSIDNWNDAELMIDFCKSNNIKYLPRALDNSEITWSYNNEQYSKFKQFWIAQSPKAQQDTIKSKYAILECFFKGCAPCEEKRLALNLLSDTISHEKLSIVYICDGKWTSQKDFREYAEKNSYKNAIYLYDGNGFLKSKLKINGYPFEILLKDGKVISTFSGFSEMIQKNYFKKQFELIK